MSFLQTAVFGIVIGWFVTIAYAFEPGAIQVAPGYELQKIMATDFGLPGQTALLPDGSLVLGDYNNKRIIRIQDSRVSTLVSGVDINSQAVATRTDGKVVYAKTDGTVMLVNPLTGSTNIFGQIPSREIVSGHQPASALATDSAGNVYAATAKRSVIQIGPAGNKIVASNLPFPDIGYALTDIDVASDGTIYVSGFNRAVAIDQTGRTTIIADGLNYEPVSVEVAPDNTVYINEVTYGLQKYNSNNNTLTQIQHHDVRPFGDILAPSVDELIFYEIQRLIVKFNFTTHELVPLFSIVGNSFAFAVNGSNTAFIGTPNHPPFLDSYIVSLQADGTRKDLLDIKYPNIISVDLDSYDRLCLATSNGFHRVESNGEITDVTPIFPPESDDAPVYRIAVSPNNQWYVISTWQKVQVYKFPISGGVSFLPIVFEPSSFDTNAYRVSEASIDVGGDGRLAIIVTAEGPARQGPFYQRVFRSDADGTNLTEIANFDANRVGGQVDIAIAPNHDIFVLAVRDANTDVIYRIDEEGKVSDFVRLSSGNDPASIDVDTSGNLWFTATNGVYRVPGVAPPSTDLPSASMLTNISTRGWVGTGDSVMIGGFIIDGNGPKKVLITAKGPALAEANVPSVLNDPTLTLYDASGQSILSNDDWGSAANVAEIQSHPASPRYPQESAILTTLNPGPYTAIVRGMDTTTGNALVEVYDLEADNDAARLTNISTRGWVGTGDSVMIGGFIIDGNGPKKVLITAKGPALAEANVPSVLNDPTLTLYDASGQSILSNDDWGSAANVAEIQSHPASPRYPQESAILTTLNPGPYTAIVRGMDTTTGNALVEIYEVP